MKIDRDTCAMLFALVHYNVEKIIGMWKPDEDQGIGYDAAWADGYEFADTMRELWDEPEPVSALPLRGRDAMKLEAEILNAYAPTPLTMIDRLIERGILAPEEESGD